MWLEVGEILVRSVSGWWDRREMTNFRVGMSVDREGVLDVEEGVTGGCGVEEECGWLWGRLGYLNSI